MSITRWIQAVPDKFDASTLGALRAKYPTLEVKGEGPRKISSCALASKNIKRLLKIEFPGVKFSVSSDIYANGSAVYVSWTQFEGDPPLRDAVDALIYPFGFGRFDGMTDSESYDDDPERTAFRSLFGSAKSTVAQCHNASPQEQAARDASRMQASTNQPEAERRPRKPGRL